MRGFSVCSKNLIVFEIEFLQLHLIYSEMHHGCDDDGEDEVDTYNVLYAQLAIQLGLSARDARFHSEHASHQHTLVLKSGAHCAPGEFAATTAAVTWLSHTAQHISTKLGLL